MIKIAILIEDGFIKKIISNRSEVEVLIMDDNVENTDDQDITIHDMGMLKKEFFTVKRCAKKSVRYINCVFKEFGR